jgi:hypothetical protein
MAKRLKGVLHKLISPLQAALVPNRILQENTILMHEIYHTMRYKQGRGGLMAIKADMEKAYDKMEWAFLLKVLECFGFSPVWIQWMAQCISTVSYSILLNGSPYGFFKPTRGLRQGDPLSPFLFRIGSEVLSRLLLRAEHGKNLHWIKISRAAPAVSHLLFADDLVIFRKANKQEAQTVQRCLEKYTRWSGQTLNVKKSSIHFSNNLQASGVTEVCNILQLKKSSPQTKDLGLPPFLQRSKKQTFIDTKERVLKRVSGWKARVLLQAGRTTLIRAVASAIPAYSMSTYLLPKSLCASIDKSLKDFWWGFKEDKQRNYTPKASESICKPKSCGALDYDVCSI